MTNATRQLLEELLERGGSPVSSPASPAILTHLHFAITEDVGGASETMAGRLEGGKKKVVRRGEEAGL